jgi:membrane protease YdiL (CAAX protease family)
MPSVTDDITVQAEPASPYLAAGSQGHHDWWRYAFSILLILFVWLGLGSLPFLFAVLVIASDDNPDTYLDVGASAIAGIHPLWNFMLLMASFVALLLAVLLAVRLIHGRSIRSLLTAAPAFRLRRLVQGFLLWLLLVAGLSLVEALLYPDRYRFTLDWSAFLLFLPFALLLIPLQTSAEELLFRGYLLQGLGRRLRHPAILLPVSGLLFMLPHLPNPEVDTNPALLLVYYAAFGVFLAWVTLRDGGLELALGVHAANNLFAGLLANYENSALSTPAVFTATELAPAFNLIGSLLAMLLFVLLLFGRSFLYNERQRGD